MDTLQDTDNKTQIRTLVSKPFDLSLLCKSLSKHGHFYCHDILPYPIIDGLYNTLKFCEEKRHFSPALIGRGHNKLFMPQIRTDKTLWINGDNPCEHEFLNFLENIRSYFNQTLFLGLSLVEAHYAIYNTGDFYARHLDSFAQSKNCAKNRIISLVIYLNKNWHINNGGLLELYPNPQAQTPCGQIIPEYNHAVFFLSEEIPHQVNVCHQNRYSIACWFRY